MGLDERVSDLIKRIYVAGQDEAVWDGIVVDFLDRTRGCAAIAAAIDLDAQLMSLYRVYGPDDPSVARGADEYAEMYKIDPGLRCASENPQRRFCDSRAIEPTHDRESGFPDWTKARFGSDRWYLGYTAPSDELSFTFALFFPIEQQHSQNEEAYELFRVIFDHMECAIRLNQRRFSADSARPIVLLDGAGLVRQRSKGAENLFSTPGALAVDHDRLRAALPREQASLDRAFGVAANFAAERTAPQALKLSNPHGRPWVVVIRPVLNSYGPMIDVEQLFHVEILEGIPKLGSLELFQSVFSLTARETQIARLLVDGHSVESLSEQMEISQNTTRVHLKSIFSKTSTSRQSELIRLCGGLAPVDS
jgi:DNA-binding CsgD family transcriptional regulator